MTKKRLVGAALLLACGALGWISTAPPSYYEPAPARRIGPVPAEVLEMDVGDVIRERVVTVAPELPGHDEVLPIPGTDYVLVSARDEWIWRIDLRTGAAERFALSPVSPTGAHVIPGRADAAYFCMARLDYHEYEQGPGLYQLNFETRKFEPVVTRVPLTGSMREDGLELPNYEHPFQDVVYSEPFRNTPVAELNESNSRPMQFCNDLDVSSDERYVYTSEPFSHPKTSSGLGAMPEAITLARNGRVWRYDTLTNEIGLVLENNVFADGILIEEDEAGNVVSLLITETVNFRIGRAFLSGPRAGDYDVLWDDLPGLPDGIDRDSDGRIWIGLIKYRTPLMKWMHANPWIKPLILRIPPEYLPRTFDTGLLALSADASEVVAYSHHDGSRVVDISVPATGGGKLFLSSFYEDNRGLHYIDIRDVLLKASAKR